MEQVIHKVKLAKISRENTFSSKRRKYISADTAHAAGIDVLNPSFITTWLLTQSHAASPVT